FFVRPLHFPSQRGIQKTRAGSHAVRCGIGHDTWNGEAQRAQTMESKGSFDEGKREGKHADEKGYNDWDDGGKEIDSDDEVEAEYQAALNKGNVGKVAVSKDPQAKSIVRGFRINWMDMRDADTAHLLWESGEWGKDMYHDELKATVPRRILECSAVSREINFTSQEEIRQFRLEQRVFLAGACIEEWFFDFGFVIPGSTNSWQQTIESAGEDRMLAAEDLSGRMTIETTFLDGRTMLFKTLVRIFYE
ncbi:unnamed protein product, partial [Ectocarpus sp. 6 AP-2014]